MWFKYAYKDVCPDYAALRGLELGILMTCEFALNRFEGHSHPVFVPNEHLYTEYAKTLPGYQELTRAEIYAHAIEDLIRREGGFGTNTQANREKVNLQQFMWSSKDEITVNGKTFHWPPNTKKE